MVEVNRKMLLISLAMAFLMMLSGFDTLDSGIRDTLAKKDDTPPQVTLGISSPTGKNGWHNQPVSVVVKAFDGESGVALRQVSIGGKVWYKNALVVKKDGTFTIYAMAVDRAGNIASTSTTIQVDLTNPELVLEVPEPQGSKGWYVNEVPVILTGSDALSGIAVTNLRIDGDCIGTEIDPLDAQEAYNAEDVRTYQKIIVGKSDQPTISQALIEESGTYRIIGFVEDLAGNRTEVVKTLQVDLIPPQVVINSPAKFFGVITLNGSILDYDSGISQLSIDTGRGWKNIYPVDSGIWEYIWDTNGLEDNQYLIKARVIDGAGHQSVTSYTANVLNHIWPVFTMMGILASLGLLTIVDPRRRAWREFSGMIARMAHMEKNAMALRKELR